MEKYGLIGYPLKHSFSKSFFNEKFTSENIDAEYLNFEIPTIKEIIQVIESNPNLKGLNVTIPYKEQIIPYLNGLDRSASSVGAVNVIKINRHKGKVSLIGYNSDLAGFTESIESLIKPEMKSALILGTGGASKAVYHGLASLGIESTFVSRNCTGKENCLTYQMLTPEIIHAHKIIVNATPIGMFPDEDRCPNIPYEELGKDHLLYDLLYNPDHTLFMKKGEDQGATVKNGLEMLLLQAYASWDIWQEDNGL